MKEYNENITKHHMYIAYYVVTEHYVNWDYPYTNPAFSISCQNTFTELSSWQNKNAWDFPSLYFLHSPSFLPSTPSPSLPLHPHLPIFLLTSPFPALLIPSLRTLPSPRFRPLPTINHPLSNPTRVLGSAVSPPLARSRVEPWPPTHCCGIRAQEIHLLITMFGYLHLQKM